MAEEAMIQVDRALYEQVQRAAAAAGVSVDEWVAKALRERLAHSEDAGSAAAEAHRDVATVAPTLERDEPTSPSLAPEVDTV